MNYTKYYGNLLMVTGVIHYLIGLVMDWSTLIDMHHSGWFSSTIVDDHMLFDREAILWFLTLGAFWIIFGWTLQKMIEQDFKIPASLGWGFIAIALIIIVPASGAYLFLNQGVLILIADKVTYSSTKLTEPTRSNMA